MGIVATFDLLADEEYLAKCLGSCQSMIRRFVRVAYEQNNVEVRTDAAALRSLRLRFTKGVGIIWDNNECLADSLLQLLVYHGLLSDDITLVMRRDACAANRALLVNHAERVLRPRVAGVAGFDRADEDPGAFLQDSLHAEPTVRYFIQRFEATRRRALPAGGILLIVHSRFDSDTLPASEMRICRVDGGGPAELPIVFDLYNMTGDGFSGYHYDPLFPVRLVGVVDGAGDPGAGAGGVLLEFTPCVINADKCLARTWSGGLGGQCSRFPVADRRWCKVHETRAMHGFVDGPVPDLKLAAFRKAAASAASSAR